MASTHLIRSLPCWQYLLVLGSLGHVAFALSPLQTCYFPDGTIAKGNFPCFLDQDASPCCSAGSICEASGLCKVKGSIGVSDLIRGACTDSSWDSPECPQYCILPDGMDGGINVISCQNVTSSNLDFCCDHTDNCCDSGIGRFQVSFNTDIVTLGTLGATVSTFVPTSTSSSRSTVATTSSSSSTSSSTMTSSIITSLGTTSSIPPSTSTVSATNAASTSTISNGSTNAPTISEKSKGLSTGAVAGIAVACTIAGIASLGGIVYYFLRKRGGTKVVLTQLEKPDDIALPPFNSAPPQTHPVEIMTNWVHNKPELQV